MRTICRDYTADRPQDSLGFLLADVSRLMRRAFARRFEGNELTFAQARVLVYVARSPGLRQVELASRLEIQPITLVRLIDGLAVRGLVERRVDPGDRRAWRVYPTVRAQGSLASIRRVGESVREDALAGIAPARAEALLHILASMRCNLASESDDDNDKAGEDEDGRERDRASHRRTAPSKARRTSGAASRQAK
ncbi:MAG: MarR family transcriptional regulator [Burkholderiaceae bacterium]|nr:MarR family transcriptional regulator [Burkholderiaceae bacterium]